MRRAQNKVQIGQRLSVWRRNKVMERKIWTEGCTEPECGSAVFNSQRQSFLLTQLYIYYGLATCFGPCLDLQQAIV